MRIGINAFPLRADGGGARYVFTSLLDALLDLPRDDQFVAFLRKDAVPLIAMSLARRPGKLRAIVIRDPEDIAAHQDQFDLLFAPINEPGPPLPGTPTVVVLHDILESIVPGAFPPAEASRRAARHAATARDCTTLVAISDTCRQSFIECFGVPAEKVAVVYNAPQAGIVSDESPVAWTREPLPSAFVFYPANTFAHKNHELLLDAIEQLPEASVVFTGYEVLGGFPLRREIARRGLGRRALHFSDLMPGEMRCLYRTALATVLPTAYEGFGLPAVEALACGCPVICSDLPALREVAGSEATFLPTGDLDAWISALRRIFAEPRKQISSDARSRVAARFNWPASAQAMAMVFDETLRRFRAMPPAERSRAARTPTLSTPTRWLRRVARRLPISWQDRIARWATVC